MIVRQYSKNLGLLRSFKDDHFQDNAKLLVERKKANQIFSAQPLRSECRICSSPFKQVFINRLGVNYYLCDGCGHLNGENYESDFFLQALYVIDDGHEYAQNYVDEQFFKRCRDIYDAKAEFLLENSDFEIRSVLDVGSGAGHMVSSMISKGIDAEGVEVNKSMVDFGNKAIGQRYGKKPLTCIQAEELLSIVRSSQHDVISAIGVIEHLPEPMAFFEAIQESQVKSLLFSVPTVSLSVLIEQAFPNVFPRLLSGAHTHLFCDTSLQYIYDRFKFTSVIEWWFGTDFQDLFRSLYVTLGANENQALRELLDRALGSTLDSFQKNLDRTLRASEVHVLLKK